MGGWIGGQARYVMTPSADFNLLKFPDRDQALAKIRDLTMLTDILPTGFHAAVRAQVGVGSTVYIAGCGPVGLATSASARILGAAVVMIGDINNMWPAFAETSPWTAKLVATSFIPAANSDKIQGADRKDFRRGRSQPFGRRGARA
jgi:threonine dehydrogenase-like Zn-dependent dehydrogenase